MNLTPEQGAECRAAFKASPCESLYDFEKGYLAGLEANAKDAERMRDALELIASLYSHEKSVGQLAGEMYEVRCIANAAITQGAKP